MKNPDDLQLKSNILRQAHDSIRGYVYQIWHTVYRWINLREDQLLFLECAEDIDVVGMDGAQAIQIKDTKENVTLRSDNVIDAINNFWELRCKNQNIPIVFHFITRSHIGHEKDSFFGKNNSGIEIWQKCARSPRLVTRVKEFLLSNNKIDRGLKEFLRVNTNKEILKKLIMPIEWHTADVSVEFIIENIEKYLIYHGEPRNIPANEAKAVKEYLFCEAFFKASEKEARHLDRARFLEIFDAATNVTSSRASLNSLIRSNAINVGVALTPSPNSSSMFEAASIIVKSPPPLFKDTVSRVDVIRKYSEALQKNGILVLSGSSGKGKSTLAKLLVQGSNDRWYWISLSGLNEHRLLSFLEVLDRISTVDATVNHIVLDDINFSPENSHVIEQTLGILISKFIERNGHIIITSQTPFPIRLSQALSLPKDVFTASPGFSEKEITEFSLLLGCPNRKLALVIGKIVLSQTKGHPQLVHARLLSCKDKGWSKSAIESILKNDDDIKEIKEYARTILGSSLDENHRELLFRLSIFCGYFRRDYGIGMGSFPPELHHPGLIFDRLKGPWIEIVENDYYQLSALLENAAMEVYLPEKVKLLRQRAIDAILETKKISLREAYNLFHLSWLCENYQSLTYTLVQLLHAPEHAWSSINTLFSYIIYPPFNRENGPVVQDILANFYFRAFQYRIASALDLNRAALIGESWNAETKNAKSFAQQASLRCILICTIVSHFKIKYNFDYLLGLLSELIDIKNDPKDGHLIDILGQEIVNSNQLAHAGPDIIDNLFVFVGARVKNADDLLSLCESLGRIDGEHFEALIGLFGRDDNFSAYLINVCWMNEVDEKTHNWDHCIYVFNRVRDIAQTNNLQSLRNASIRGLSIIYDEYLYRPDEALQIIEQYNNGESHRSCILEDARAVILFRKENYCDALKIWNIILPIWKNISMQGPIIMHALRRAAISASNLGLWNKVSPYYLDAYNVTETENTILRLGLLADMAFALWKAGEIEKAIEAFRDILTDLYKVPNLIENTSAFALHKMVGHTLLWIKRQVAEEYLPGEIVEPIPGMCSNQDRHKDITQLPTSHISYSWMHLFWIELYSNSKTNLCQTMLDGYINSNMMTLRQQALELKIHIMLRGRNYSSPSSLINEYCNALYVSMQAIKDGYGICDEYDKDIKSAPQEYIGGILSCTYFAMLAISIFDASFNDELLDEWMRDAKQTSLKDYIVDWIAMAKRTLELDYVDAFKIMNGSENDARARLVAALRMLILNQSPNKLFYAQSLIFHHLVNSPWKMEVGAGLSSYVSHLWLFHVLNPSSLNLPQFVIPKIIDACNLPINNIAKLKSIINASSYAVSIQLPDSIKALLNEQ